MNWEAILLTAELAAIVSTILLIAGIPITYWISFSRWRWKFFMEVLVVNTCYNPHRNWMLNIYYHNPYNHLIEKRTHI